MTQCNHKKVLFIPQGTETKAESSGEFRLTFTEPKFLCVACREYIPMPNRRRLVNVPQYDSSGCTHPDKIYTLDIEMGSQYLCLNCGSSWTPEPPKVDRNWEAEDKRFRDDLVDNWLATEKDPQTKGGSS